MWKLPTSGNPRFGLLALAVAALPTALTACGAGGPGPDGGGALVATRGDLVDELVLTGELAAAVAVELAAPDVPIRPLEIRWIAEEGKEVRQGERLVEFDNTSLIADLEDRRTRVQEAVNQLAKARADAAVAVADARLKLASAEAAYEKAKLDAQVPEDLVSAVEYGERQLALERTKLEWRQAQEALEAKRVQGGSDLRIAQVAEGKARVELERSLRSIELLALAAPRDGIFLPEMNFSEGRSWAEGDSLWPGQKVARLPDLGSIQVRAQLADVDGDAVEVGQKATVTLDAYPDRSFDGRVKEVEQAAHQAGFRSARRFFGVTVEMDGVDASWMRPGMSARVALVRGVCEGCLLIPRESLTFDGNGAPRVRLASGGWSPPVRLGTCSDLHCAVEDGLEEGAALAPSPEPAPSEAGGAPA